MVYKMRSTEALPEGCPNGGQHDNVLCLRLEAYNDGEGNYGVYVICPECGDHAHLEGVENIADYLAGYATDDIFRLENYGVISWDDATAVATARADKELEEGHASCLNCAGVFAAATDTECAWCGADVTPQLPTVEATVTKDSKMTDYRVHAIEGDTSYLKPDGDCYAPQVALTWDRFHVNTTELNTESLPLSVESIVNAFESFNRDTDLTLRWLRIVTGREVLAHESTGYSQGDIAVVFVFDTEEWRAITGASVICESDAIDLASWLWGDVYEVSYRDDIHADEHWHVYGMDAAMEYGTIIFPTTHTYTTYED